MSDYPPVPTPEELTRMGCPQDSAQEVSDKIAAMDAGDRPITLDDVQGEIRKHTNPKG